MSYSSALHFLLYKLCITSPDASFAFSIDEPHCSCRVTYKAVGCEIDKANDRALPEMLLNERDKYSPYYDGFDVDWANWDEYLPAFTCRCAEAAMTKGYKYFGLQNWGEV